MKRLLVGSLLGLLTTLVLGSSVGASANDFMFSNFEARYYLGVDSDKRSTLKTVETLTAEFPDFDQNHGIERAIPEQYDGHSTNLKIESVKKPNGENWNYTTHTTNGNLVLRIGDGDVYVHGTQSYVITYTQRDVTKYFSNTNDDEFYWDTNGTLWPQSFAKVSAVLEIAPELKDSVSGDISCTEGYQGSTDKCTIQRVQNADGTTVLSVRTTRPLSANENMTLAVGFAPKTFAVYTPTAFEKAVAVVVIIQTLLVPIALILSAWFLIRLYRSNGRKSEVGSIVPEYLPPKDISVTTAAQLISGSRSVMAAQLLDLAVRHYIKIYEVKPKKLFSAAQYEIEVIKDPSALLWEEKELLSDSFGALPSVGQKLNLKTLRNNTSYYARTINNDSDLQKLVKGEYALQQKDPKRTTWFRRAALILLILAVVTLSPVLLFPSLFALLLSFLVSPLTDKGLSLYRYLEGLKMYIKVAEQERIRLLQSPEGAAKVAEVSDGSDDPRQRITLYEHVLPYAVLFGQEKEWNKQLGRYYEQAGAQPGWYSGNNGVFNAAVFGSAMSSFASSTSYSSSSSSNSGGSSGGSSGGGGGGGGGGW